MKLTQALEGFRIDRISNGYSPATISSYQYNLKRLVRYLKDPELEKISHELVVAFFYDLRTQSDLSSASIKKMWISIRSFYNWVVSEFDIIRPDDIPCPHSESKQVIPFTEEEIKALLRACDMTTPAHTERRKGFVMARPTALRDRALVLLLLDTGLRASE